MTVNNWGSVNSWASPAATTPTTYKLPRDYQTGFKLPGVKPVVPVEIDWSNPLSEGLVAFVVFGGSGVNPLEVVSNRPLVANGTPSASFGAAGQCLATDSIGEYWTLFDNESEHLTPESTTVLVGTRKTDGIFRQLRSFGGDQSPTTNSLTGYIGYSGGIVYWDFGGNSGNNRINYTAGAQLLTYGSFAFSAGPSGMRIIRNGVLEASNSANLSPRTLANSPFRINKTGAESANGDLAEFYHLAIFNRDVPQEQASALTLDPYQLLKPVNELYFRGAVAAPAATTPTPYKLPRNYQPGFKLPGVKPLSSYQIDWSHPLARGLVACVVGAEGKNLVTGDTASSNIAKTVGYNVNGQVSRFASAGRETFPPPKSGNFLGDHSSFVRAKIGTFGRTLYLLGGFGESLAENVTQTLLTTTDKKLSSLWEYGAGSNVSYDTSATFSANADEWHSYGISRKTAASSTVDFYFDGGLLETASGLTNPAGGFGTGTVHLSIPGNHLAASQDFQGDLDICLLWERQLTPEEHASLSANPYQLLKPVNELAFSTTITAPAATTTPPTYNLPRNYQAGFKLPGVNPSSPFKLNTKSQLVDKLLIAAIPHQGVMVEAVSGRALQSTVPADVLREFDSKGELSRQASTGSDCYYPLEQNLIGTSNTWSLTWKAAKNDYGASDGMVLGWDANTRDFVWMSATTNQINFRNSAGLQTNIPTNGVSNDVYVWRTLVLSAATIDLYIDGVLASSVATVSSNEMYYNSLLQAYNNPIFRFKGRFGGAFVHDRELSAVEIKSLHADPFQIIEPTNELSFSTSITAPAVTTPTTYNLPRNYQTGFRLPGVKPVVPAVIDWSNPLAPTGMCVLPNGLGVSDYATGFNTGPFAGTTPDYPNALSMSNIGPKAFPRKTFSGDFTATLKVATNDPAPYGAITVSDSGSSNNYIWLRTTSSEIRLQASGNVFAFSDVSWTAAFFSNVHEYVFSRSGSTIDLYVDGEFHSSATVGSNSFIVGELFGWTANANYHLDGSFHYFFMDNAALPAAAIRERYRDPYQLLKPVNELSFGGAVAGVDAGGEVTGTATQTAGAANHSATGERVVTGTAAHISGAAAHATTGERAVTGTSTQASGIASHTATGTNGATHTGTSTQTSGTATHATTGERVVTGTSTQTSGTATHATTGERVVTGTSTQTSAASTHATTGERVVTGTSTQASAAASHTAVGSVGGSHSGTSTQVSGPASHTATGLRLVGGTSTQVAGPTSHSATAEREITGTAAQVSGAASHTATGEVDGAISGVSTQVSGPASHTATGLRLVGGTSVQQAPPATHAAQAEREVTGTSPQASGAATHTATGIGGVAGASTQSSGPAAHTAAGKRTVTGTSGQVSGTAAHLALGAGVSVITGLSTQTSGPSTHAATGSRVVAGTLTLVSGNASHFATPFIAGEAPSQYSFELKAEWGEDNLQAQSAPMTIVA